MKQTILGAGGAIGIELAKALTSYTSEIRLVSRNPKKINDNDELFPADLTHREDVFKAIAGSEIVYVTVGPRTPRGCFRKKARTPNSAPRSSARSASIRPRPRRSSGFAKIAPASSHRSRM